MRGRCGGGAAARVTEVLAEPGTQGSWQLERQEIPCSRLSDSSIGKESACNAGNPGSITGSERSSGDGMGYPLQCSWAYLVAQLVKNLLEMRETWVRSLGWEDPPEKGTATHSSILAWRIPCGCKELDH